MSCPGDTPKALFDPGWNEPLCTIPNQNKRPFLHGRSTGNIEADTNNISHHVFRPINTTAPFSPKRAMTLNRKIAIPLRRKLAMPPRPEPRHQPITLAPQAMPPRLKPAMSPRPKPTRPLQPNPHDRPITLATILGATSLILPSTTLIHLATTSHFPTYTFIYTCAISGLTFLVYGYDKTQARNLEWRVRRRTLHALALVGGWPGALAGMHYFQHKTAKVRFQAVFWGIVVAWEGFWWGVWRGGVGLV